MFSKCFLFIILKELSRKDGTKLEFTPARSNRPSAYREPEAWLNVTFALAPTQESAILFYRTAEHANSALDIRPFSFMSPSRPRITNPQDNHRPDPHDDPPVENDRFVVEPSNALNANRLYTVYIRRLASSIDEVDIEEELKLRECPLPFYLKIIRGDEIAIPKTHAKDVPEEALLDYAIFKGFLPFQDKIIDTYVKKDAKRKLVTIRARYETMDDVEMVFVTQPHMTHLDQSVRFQADFRISLRVEKALWQYRETQIQAFLDGLKVLRVTFKVSKKFPTHIWLFVEAPRLEFLDAIRKKVDEFLQCKFYKHAHLDLLFTRYGNQQLLSLNVKPGFIHLNFTSKQIRIYGDEQERDRVVRLLDRLVEKLQTIVIDASLVIRKSSLVQVEKNLPAYRNTGLKGEIRLFHTRMIVTGSAEGIGKLKIALKDHLLPPRTAINPGECGLCFDTLINPISLQVKYLFIFHQI